MVTDTGKRIGKGPQMVIDIGKRIGKGPQMAKGYTEYFWCKRKK